MRCVQPIRCSPAHIIELESWWLRSPWRLWTLLVVRGIFIRVHSSEFQSLPAFNSGVFHKWPFQYVPAPCLCVCACVCVHCCRRRFRLRSTGSFFRQKQSCLHAFSAPQTLVVNEQAWQHWGATVFLRGMRVQQRKLLFASSTSSNIFAGCLHLEASGLGDWWWLVKFISTAYLG